MKSFLLRALDNLDVTLAAASCVLAIPVTSYVQSAAGNPVYGQVGVIVLVTCLAYLVLRRRGSVVIQERVETTPHVYMLLNLLFFALLTYSILGCHLRPDVYTRPLGYFIATAAMAAVLAVEILLLPRRKSTTCFVLFKVCIIGLSLAWSQVVLYPDVVGVDPWDHRLFTAQMLEAGHITPGHRYFHLPGLHLLVGGVSLVTGLDYKMSAMLSVSLAQVVCNVLFVFLLGRFVRSTKAGLMAALLLAVANWHINFAHSATANSLAVVFIPIVVYLLLKLRRHAPNVSIGLSVVLTAALLITHTIAAVNLMMLLFAIWLGFLVYSALCRHPVPEGRIFAVSAAALTGAGLGYWSFVSGHIAVLSRFAEMLASMVLPGVGTAPGEPTSLEIAVAFYQQHVVSGPESLFKNVGFFLFCAFALFGSFVMLSKRVRDRNGFALITAGLIVLPTSFFVLYNLTDFLIGRFSYFLQILLAVPLGAGLIALGGLASKRVASACLIGMTVLALSFLMIMSPKANQDNGVITPNTIVRFGFTTSELQGADMACRIWDGSIVGDVNYRSLTNLPQPERRIEPICGQLHSRDFSHSRDTLVLIRDEIVVRPFKIWRLSPFRLDYDPRELLMEQGFSRIYENRSVSGFVG